MNFDNYLLKILKQKKKNNRIANDGSFWHYILFVLSAPSCTRYMLYGLPIEN